MPYDSTYMTFSRKIIETESRSLAAGGWWWEDRVWEVTGRRFLSGVMKMYHFFCWISSGWVRDSFHSTDNLKKKNLLHLASLLLYLHFSSSFKSSFCFHWMYWSSWDFPEKQCCLHPAERSGVLLVHGLCADCLIPLGDLCSFQPAGNTLANSIQR